MKQGWLCRSVDRESVASHAEAWIETYSRCDDPTYFNVASHAEAWIETFTPCVETNGSMVASHAEAWIETGPRSIGRQYHVTSPLTRRRGLKLASHGDKMPDDVASHAEAWIETIG